MDISKVKEKLEAERKKLIYEVLKEETPEDFGSDIDHGEEEANEAESFGNRLSISQTMRQRITEIDAALSRIAEGKYGVCEKCGGKIEKEVLDVVPESRFCRSCKKK